MFLPKGKIPKIQLFCRKISHVIVFKQVFLIILYLVIIFEKLHLFNWQKILNRLACYLKFKLLYFLEVIRNFNGSTKAILSCSFRMVINQHVFPLIRLNSAFTVYKLDNPFILFNFICPSKRFFVQLIFKAIYTNILKLNRKNGWYSQAYRQAR